MCGDPLQRIPEVDDRLTMAPAPCASITGNTCLQLRNTLLRLYAIWLSQVSSDSSTGPPGIDPPTLLTRISIRPNFSRQAATIALLSAVFVTSQICVVIAPAC